MSALDVWRQRYRASHLVPIPVAAGSKRPIVDAWQVAPADDQWRQVGSTFRGNLAILMGGGVAVVDCDAPQTIDAARAGFDGMGIKPPYVTTPSGGRHFYLHIDDAPTDYTWSKLGIGAGEFRVRRAVVIAPCSTVETRHYRWGKGTSPEHVIAQRTVKWRDVQWLIAGTASARAALDAPPIRLVYRPMPARASVLLQALRKASKGRAVGKYASRSEAEAAVIAMLILSGWQIAEIRQLFDDALPGHYASYPSKPRRSRYLETTYRQVLNHIADTPERYELANWYAAAERGEWPGSGGALERSTYMALCAVGWQFSTYQPQASQRVIAEFVASNRRWVGSALTRLFGRSLIRRLSAGAGAIQAATFEIMPFYSAQQGDISLTANTVTIGDGLSTSASAELWRPGALGRTFGMIYAHLSDNPLSIAELAKRTGKNKRTVKRSLQGYTWRDRDGIARRSDGMKHYDLAVEHSNGWVRGAADLGQLAVQFEADSSAEQRRRKHDDERIIQAEARFRAAENRNPHTLEANAA